MANQHLVEPKAEAAVEKTAALVILRELEQEIRLLDAQALAAAAGISEVAARILLSRGFLNAETVRDFLTPNMRSQLPNPATIKNIVAAADLLLDFVESRELITIYNDFDVDGVSSASQLLLYLKALGAKVNTYTPSRFAEGYGLVSAAVEKLGKLGTKLLTTVDCGITSVREIALAKKLGMRAIIVDHHVPGPELPDADVVVDPARDGCPFQEHKLAAAGLVWMLLIVLRQRAKDRWGDAKVLPDPKDFLDLAALGTICDMVPLIGVNRIIAHRGVEAMRSTTRPGIIALMEVAGVYNNPRFGSGQVSFGLGPRINAAGRLADAAEAVLMLTTDDSNRARSIAAAIDRLNDERRRVEDEVRVACLEMIEASPELATKPALALYGEKFHIGVIGIVAQRLVEAFHRPVAVMAPGELEVAGGKKIPVIKGSVRSVRGFHVAEALQSMGDLLISGGGHSEAGGFSVRYENLEKFQEAFVARAAAVLGADAIRRQILADVEVDFSVIDFELVNELMRFAPFGVGNPSPVLVTRNVDVATVTALKEKHVRVRFSQDRFFMTALGWGFQGHTLLRKGQRVSIAYQPEINVYQGVSSVQLNLREIWTAP